MDKIGTRLGFCGILSFEMDSIIERMKEICSYLKSEYWSRLIYYLLQMMVIIFLLM